MPLELSHLVAALRQFPAYHAIDVFADDLGELRGGEVPVSARPLDARSFLFNQDGASFKLEIFPEHGVARVSKPEAPSAGDAVAGVVAGSLVGAALDSAEKRKAGGLGGLLFGLLVGASLGKEAGGARRVFALAYDHSLGKWRAYDGGLLRWMKSQLALSAS